MIKIGSLKLDPIEYAINGNAILGIKDSGKSYTATLIAEQLFEAKIPFTVFDPTGVWKYLKIPGKGRGYPVVVAAEENGDFPLTVASAPAIVRAAMVDRISLVLDLSGVDFSKADWRRIVTSSINVMLHENGQYGLRHLFLEEAAEFIPQKISDPQVYGAVEKLARIGGNARLGYTIINQRSQEVAKSVLELCESVFLHRQRGKNALENLTKWLDVTGDIESRKIIHDMPNLPQGECFAWIGGKNPQPPVRIKVGTKNSLHPNRRAMHGELAANAKPVDATAFIEQMKDALPRIEEQRRENDPAELKKRIAELERAAGSTTTPEMVNNARNAGFANGRSSLRGEFARALAPVENQLRAASNALAAAMGAYQDVVKLCDPPAGVDQTPPMPQSTAIAIKSNGPIPVATLRYAAASSLPKGERAVLSAIAQSRNGMTRQHLTVQTGYKRSSRDAYLQRLRNAGCIQDGDRITITTKGIEALGSGYEPQPTGERLRAHVLTTLPAGERRILECAIAAYPGSSNRDQISEETEYKRSSRDAYIQRLAARELIEESGRGSIRASAHLFE